MGGFCVHEWHQTTEEDLIQMSYGEDYWMYAGADAACGFGKSGWWSGDAAYRAERKREYAIHDEAIRLAKDAGLVFHELPDSMQGKIWDKAKVNLTRTTTKQTEAGDDD